MQQTSIIDNALLKEGGETTMRDSSYNSSHQSKQTFSRGGEKKVMKKSLSLLLAIALVFGMFYSVAAAATTAPTPAEAGKQLQDYKIIEGSNGDLMVDSTWLRQDIAVLLSRLLGVEATAKAHAKTHTFADVKGTFYDGYLSWAKEEGYIIGNSPTKFGFGDKLTNQQFAAIVLRVFGIDDYANAVEKAIGYGILPAGANATDPAKRGDTFVGIVAALNTEVPGLGITLGAQLGLPGFESKAAVASAAAAGVKKVNVTFSKAVDTSKVVLSVKKDGFSVNVTNKTWDDAKKVVTLETPVTLATGEYTVTASGIELATGKDSVKFTVSDEVIASVWVDDAAYRQTGNANIADLSYKLVNQYGEEFSNYSGSDIQVTPAIATVTAGAPGKNSVTLTGISDKTALTVTVVETKSAKVTTKEVAVRNAKALSSLTLGALELPSGKTAFESGNTYKLPVVAKDQYGNVIDVTALPTGITWVKSDEITGVTYAEKNKLNVAIGPFNGPKTLSLQVIVNATGGNSKIEIAVNGAKEIADVSLIAPSSRIGKTSVGEIELQAKDQYGNAMSADDVVAAAGASKLTIVAGNSSIFTLNTVAKNSDGKAVVRVNAVEKGTANLTVTVNSTGKSSTLSVTIVDAKYPQSVTLAPDFTKAVYDGANGGVITLKASFKDQYGDDINGDTTASLVKITLDNSNFLVGGGNTVSTTIKNLVDNGVAITANAKNATTTVKVELFKETAQTNVYDTKTQVLTAAKGDEALTYQVEDLGTILATDVAAASTSDATKYTKTVKINAVDASGTKVALPAAALQSVVAGDANVTVAGNVVTGAAGKEGDSKVYVNIAKADGSFTVVTAPVKVSKSAPVATKIEWKNGDNVVTTATATSANIDFVSGTNKVVVTDQYGTTALSDKALFFVSIDGGALTALTSGDTDFDFTPVATGKKVKVTAAFGDKSATIEFTKN
jgi:hypothetical protein